MNLPGAGAMVVQLAGWSLVHFLWQAALVGVAYGVLRWLLPRGNARYVAAMLAMVALAVLPLLTGLYEWHVFARAAPLAGSAVTGALGSGLNVAVSSISPGWQAWLGRAMPSLVLVWGCGVVLLGLRVARQWWRLQAIVRAAEALPAWQARAEQLGRRLGLGITARILASVRIATPTLVGWVRPAVVLPLAVLARMPVEQVDWILAHELAHLRRLDHLANLFQVVLETALFYHPVVHWISRDARRERELCCDALAMQAAGGKRRDFVAALAGLEEFRADHSDLALAATGGLLAERAWFVAGIEPPPRHVPARSVVVLLALAGSALLLGVVRWHAASTRADAGSIPAASVSAPAPHAVFARRVLPAVPPSVALSSPQATAAAPLWMPRVKISLQRSQIAVQRLHDSPATAPALTMPRFATLAPVPAVVHRAAVAAPAAAPAMPKALRVVAPDYPQQALMNGTRGSVVVAFTVDGDGRPDAVGVVTSTPQGVFDAAALAAIRHWRFSPPATSGRRYQQTFRFDPEQAGSAGAAADSDGCRYVTGSHICRDRFDTSAALKVHSGARP